MLVHLGPTGRLAKGHVLDVAVKPFEQALKDYDKNLYIEWNPYKLKGWGCWEIRKLPVEKSVVDTVTYHGNTIVRIEYLENDVANHVLDCAFLNYDQLRKIKEMDTWRDDHWIHDIEYREQKAREERRNAVREELTYALKQHKGVFRELKERVRSGQNAAKILTNNGQK